MPQRVVEFHFLQFAELTITQAYLSGLWEISTNALDYHGNNANSSDKCDNI